MTKNSLVQILESKFQPLANPEKAIPMKNYMKGKFNFYGIPTKERRAIYKPVIKDFLQVTHDEFVANVKALYEHEMRDMHYAGMEYAEFYFKKNLTKEDIHLIEYLIVTNSWWDTVDMVATHSLGTYLSKFPEEKFEVVNSFLSKNNFWLTRSCILFQLKYKTNTDFTLLAQLCEENKESKEFFIQKAIGWALREYSKTNPVVVKDFVEKTNLKPLSKKEAMKQIANFK